MRSIAPAAESAMLSLGLSLAVDTLSEEGYVIRRRLQLLREAHALYFLLCERAAGELLRSLDDPDNAPSHYGNACRLARFAGVARRRLERRSRACS